MSINRKQETKTNQRFSRRAFIKSSVGLATATVASGGLLRSANAQSQFGEYIPYDSTRDYHYSSRYGRSEIIEHHHPGTEPTGEKFTFVRLKYPGGDWWTNLVNVYRWQSDLKFTQVLAANTAIDVDLRKHPQYVDIDDSWLFAYPFLYMTGHGRTYGGMKISDDQVRKLREYFERGGFLHVEDCDIRYNRFRPQIINLMKRIYPEKNFERLDMSHPIYDTLYPHDEYLGGDKLVPKFDFDEAIMDDDGKVMVYFCPSDLNCAWEGRVCEPGGEEQRIWAFEQGMNVVAYALTR
ncbi:MAG: DUF4159 domain-containing protein [Candidatus Poribacteria bacterium]|nr:DUF4159 domain-containing protein [Candidatus Poribacteria bacterium]